MAWACSSAIDAALREKGTRSAKPQKESWLSKILANSGKLCVLSLFFLSFWGWLQSNMRIFGKRRCNQNRLHGCASSCKWLPSHLTRYHTCCYQSLTGCVVRESSFWRRGRSWHVELRSEIPTFKICFDGMNYPFFWSEIAPHCKNIGEMGSYYQVW